VTKLQANKFYELLSVAQAGFCSGGASHWRRKRSIFSYFAQRSFRCHSSISGLM